MKEIKNDLEELLKTGRKSIGPVRKATLQDNDILSFLSEFSDKLNRMLDQVRLLSKKKRGNSKELAEECAAMLEDSAGYIDDITEQYRDNQDRTILADNLEEALEMLEDILYLDESF